jgi:hypothetical protein
MSNHGDTGQTKQYQHTFFSFFRFFLGIGIILVIVFSAPLVVGRFVGHFWGLLIALINMVVYVWFGTRQAMAFTTRLIWIVGIGFLLCIMGFEFAQMHLK